MQIAPVTMHPDVAASPKQVQDRLGPRQLLVRSQFVTLQGEGPSAGLVRFFVRLGGCNLGPKISFCQGCDTDFRLSESKALGFDEVFAARAAAIAHLPLQAQRMVAFVITGGEPSLHGEALSNFVEEAAHREIPVEIETNGFDTDTLTRCYVFDAHIVCSPKASFKGYAEGSIKALLEEVAKVDPGQDPFSMGILDWKFVVSADVMNAHHTIPLHLFNEHQRHNHLYVSPCTVYRKAYQGEISSAWDPNQVDQKATAANYAYAAHLCLQHGLRFSMQQHTFTSIP